MVEVVTMRAMDKGNFAFVDPRINLPFPSNVD
jgi:hypothetical protein